MDTLDLLEDVLADYDGTPDPGQPRPRFRRSPGTSTIALNGQGGVAETPGGWKDFLSQNPDFFGRNLHSAAAARGGAKAAPAAPPNARLAKLTYKDQRRLEELEGLMPRLTAQIAADEKRLEDPGLYARDPKGFDKLMAALAPPERRWRLRRKSGWRWKRRRRRWRRG